MDADAEARPISRPPPINVVVNELGVGPSQILVMILGPGGMAFCDGMEIALFGCLTNTLSNSFNLGPSDRALLVSVVALGTTVGNFAGYLGDRYGRRRLVVVGFGFLALFGFTAAHAPSIAIFLLARFMLGFSMVIGQSPAEMLIREYSPHAWQVPLGAGTLAGMQAGALTMLVLVSLEDPSLEHLNWRWLMQLASVVAALFFILAFTFLPESPVFLASSSKRGAKAEALEALDAIRRLNSREHVSIEFASETNEESEPEESTESGRTMLQQFARTFSVKHFATTMTFCIAQTAQAVAMMTQSFVVPQVLGTTSTLEPAYQLIFTNVFSGVMVIFSTGIANRLARANAMSIGLWFIAASLAAFAFVGTLPRPRPLFWEVIFQVSNAMPVLGIQVCFLVTRQVVKEQYPSNLASTALSVMMGINRSVMIIVPILFEHLRAAAGGDWEFWFYGAASWALVSSVIVLAWGVRQEDYPRNDAIADGTEAVEYGTLKAH